jgi:hypothetical protein
MKNEQLYIQDWLRKFEQFVMDSMAEGHHNNFDDHHNFIKASLEAYCNKVDMEDQPWG